MSEEKERVYTEEELNKVKAEIITICDSLEKIVLILEKAIDNVE